MTFGKDESVVVGALAQSVWLIVWKKSTDTISAATARCGVARARGTCSPDGMDAPRLARSCSTCTVVASASRCPPCRRLPRFLCGADGAVPRRFHRDGRAWPCLGEMARRFRQLIVTPEAVTAAPGNSSAVSSCDGSLAPPPEEALPPGPESSPCSAGSFQ